MKFEIETYKGQTIEYNDYDDKFVCDIIVEDKYKNTKRSSLKDIRKEIDSFIKLNLEFKPFKALFISTYNEDSFDVMEVTAIRTDGSFVVNNGSRNSYFNKKDMLRCRNYDADIVEQKENLEKVIEDTRKLCNSGIESLGKKLVKMDLSKYDKFIDQATNNH